VRDVKKARHCPWWSTFPECHGHHAMAKSVEDAGADRSPSSILQGHGHQYHSENPNLANVFGGLSARHQAIALEWCGRSPGNKKSLS